MVAPSLSEHFTSNVFITGDQMTDNPKREKLVRMKNSSAAELPLLNIAASNIRPMEAGTGAELDLLLRISQDLRARLLQMSAPLEQLQDAPELLSEAERKQLYNTIGLHSTQILEMVDQLLDKQMPREEAPAAAQPETRELDFSNIRQTTPTGRRCSAYDQELLSKLFSIMEENLEETGFNIHKMCGMLHLSHMHLIRKVKQLTGKKTIDLLKSYRLKRAQELLRQNNLNVAEVAYKVGYDMPNSFSRAFKKEFGISPTEYTY